MPHVRFLVPGDEAIAEAYLRDRSETTMILRSNLARGGLLDHGATYEGTYVGAFDDGALVGLAALYWNGNVALAAGPHVAALTDALAARAERGFRGLLGTVDEVSAAMKVEHARFGARVRKEHLEILYALSLSELRVPPQLEHLAHRSPRAHETSLVLDWRMQYVAELSDVVDTPDERERQRELVDAFHRDGHDVLLFDGAAPVAYSGFNAEIADMVQVGGVFVPPALRGRGYAKCAVAASLVDARARGAARAILFTGRRNIAAQRAYAALGFAAIGDYALVVYD